MDRRIDVCNATMKNYSQNFPNESLARTMKTEDCYMDNTSLRVPLAVFYALFFLFGLAGNLLALWVFLRLHPKKNSVRIFLINLALADLLLVICLPFRVAYHSNNNRWMLPSLLCRIVGNVFYMNMYISIALLGFISVDRYLKFQRASSRRWFLQSRWSAIVCGVLWVVSFTAVSPLIVKTENNTETLQCFQYKKLRDTKWKAYFNFVIVAIFWVVYGALVMSYGKIGMKLITASRDKPDFPNAAKYNKTAWKSFFVLFIFTVCYTPYHFVRIFYIISQMAPDVSCDKMNVLDKTNEVVLLLSALNSCLDPVMYFLLCSSIRKVTLKFICNCFSQQTKNALNSSSDTPQEQPKIMTVVPVTNCQGIKTAKLTNK